MAKLPRVASLIPSGTDIVAAMGLGATLVGVSHACDHPAARGLPILTSSSVAGAGLSSAAIDRRVSEAAAAGEPLYRTDAALLVSLSPDVVLSQDICDVCAVPGSDAASALPAGAQLVMLRGTTLEGLEDDLAAVGAAIGVGDRAEQQVRAIRSAHAFVRRRVRGFERPRVATLEWGDPPWLGGHWVPELIDVAGGTPVLAEAGAPSRRSSWEEIAAADPDAVVFLPCGYGIAEAAQQGRELAARPEVAALRAVRSGRFWAVDAARLFSRLTPAVVTAAPVLASLLHPDRFPPVGPRRAVPLNALNGPTTA